MSHVDARFAALSQVLGVRLEPVEAWLDRQEFLLPVSAGRVVPIGVETYPSPRFASTAKTAEDCRPCFLFLVCPDNTYFVCLAERDLEEYRVVGTGGVVCTCVSSPEEVLAWLEEFVPGFWRQCRA